MSKKVLKCLKWVAALLLMAAICFLVAVAIWKLTSDVYHHWSLLKKTWDTDGTFRFVGIVVTVTILSLSFLSLRKRLLLRISKKFKRRKYARS